MPLIPPTTETEQRGVIKPLPDSVLPKIKWQLRYVNQTESKVDDDQSADLRQLPLLLARRQDAWASTSTGPPNDKGLYALVPLKKVSTI